MKSERATWLAVGLLPLVVVALVVSADTHTWTGASLAPNGNNNWNDNANWQVAGAPFSPDDDDSAIIDDTSPQSTVQYNEGDNDYAMVDLLLGDGMTLSLSTGTVLNVHGLMTVDGNATVTGAGNLSGTPHETFTGRIRIEGGTSGASLTKQGTGDLVIGGRVPPP